MRIWTTLAATLALAACATETPQTPAAPEAPAAFQQAPMSPAALRAHVEVLASDQFGGRFPGTEGETLTVDYLERAFAAAGLQPAVTAADGSRSFRQHAQLVSATIAGTPTLSITGRDGARSYAYADQFVVWSKRIQPAINVENAELVFVGYGVNDPVSGWNDYAGVDMRGRIAVILVNDPDYETGDDRGFNGRAMTYYGRWIYKFEEVARQGALGAILIHETGPAAYGWEVVRSSRTGPLLDIVPADRGMGRAAFESWVTEPVARELFQRAGMNFDQMKRRAQTRGFRAAPMRGLRLSTSFNLTHREFQSDNVIGVLPGRTNPDEVVLYSAHWDHMGRCPPVNGDDICNGALDNATGTAGLIELARQFQAQGAPARSVAFIAFTAEEQGLLGSAYYAEHPTFPAAQTVAAINMDGLNNVGPTRDIVVVGGGKSELEPILDRATRAAGRIVAQETYPERGSFYRSDHLNFARIGIPSLYTGAGIDLVNGGVAAGRAANEDYVANRYHRPDDEITPQWNLDGGAADLALLYAVGREVADGNAWPNWLATNEFRPIRDRSRTGR